MNREVIKLINKSINQFVRVFLSANPTTVPTQMAVTLLATSAARTGGVSGLFSSIFNPLMYPSPLLCSRFTYLSSCRTFRTVCPLSPASSIRRYPIAFHLTRKSVSFEMNPFENRGQLGRKINVRTRNDWRISTVYLNGYVILSPLFISSHLSFFAFVITTS